jgi:hypothetical protein
MRPHDGASDPSWCNPQIHSRRTGLLHCFKIICMCLNDHRHALDIGQIHSHCTRLLHYFKMIYMCPNDHRHALIIGWIHSRRTGLLHWFQTSICVQYTMDTSWSPNFNRDFAVGEIGKLTKRRATTMLLPKKMIKVREMERTNVLLYIYF